MRDPVAGNWQGMARRVVKDAAMQAIRAYRGKRFGTQWSPKVRAVCMLDWVARLG